MKTYRAVIEFEAESDDEARSMAVRMPADATLVEVQTSYTSWYALREDEAKAKAS